MPIGRRRPAPARPTRLHLWWWTLELAGSQKSGPEALRRLIRDTLLTYPHMALGWAIGWTQCLAEEAETVSDIVALRLAAQAGLTRNLLDTDSDDPRVRYRHLRERLEQLRGLRFVVTLDADTQLPTGAAQRLLGTFAHPLNLPQFDRDGNLNGGYTILQPRVETSPESANRSVFSRAYTGDTLLDLYSAAVSDVYHDVIGSGIFAGKGVYEVAALERSLEGRVPDNAILSHDLFEGLHGRVGFVSDVIVFEDFPASVPAFMRRLHRWIRGDWQLLPWLRRRVPIAAGGRASTRLTVSVARRR